MTGTLSSQTYSLSHVGDQLLFDPAFLRCISCSLHFLLLLLVFSIWVFKKFINTNSYRKEHDHMKARLHCYMPTIFSCMSISLFNLVLCLLTEFYWYANGWSEEKMLTFSDFLVRAVSWSVISAVLHTQFLNSAGNKYHLILRGWWGCFLVLSCYCLAVDIFYHKKSTTLATQFWISDVVSTVLGVFFCCVGFWGKKEGGGDLSDPLLNANSCINGGKEKSPSGYETVTLYINATILSTFTCSWLNPLISLVKKRSLNLADIPQLAGFYSIRSIFPVFRRQLMKFCGEFGLPDVRHDSDEDKVKS